MNKDTKKELLVKLKQDLEYYYRLADDLNKFNLMTEYKKGEIIGAIGTIKEIIIFIKIITD